MLVAWLPIVAGASALWNAYNSSKKQGEANDLNQQAIDLAMADYMNRQPMRDQFVSGVQTPIATAPDLSSVFASSGSSNPFWSAPHGGHVGSQLDLTPVAPYVPPKAQPGTNKGDTGTGDDIGTEGPIEDEGGNKGDDSRPEEEQDPHGGGKQDPEKPDDKGGSGAGKGGDDSNPKDTENVDEGVNPTNPTRPPVNPPGAGKDEPAGDLAGDEGGTGGGGVPVNNPGAGTGVQLPGGITFNPPITRPVAQPDPNAGHVPGPIGGGIDGSGILGPRGAPVVPPIPTGPAIQPPAPQLGGDLGTIGGPTLPPPPPPPVPPPVAGPAVPAPKPRPVVPPLTQPTRRPSTNYGGDLLL